MKKILLIALSVVLGCLVCHPAPSAFRHYATDNGLPSNTVRDILQDSIGFMWMATDGGLTRFDGLKFKLFPVLDDKGDEVKDVYIGSIKESGGRLWAASDDRLLIYDSAREALTEAPLVYAPGHTRRIDAVIKAMATDAAGNLWVSCASNGVFRVDTRTMEVTAYDVPELSNTAGMIFVDSRDDVWLANNQGKGVLMRLDRSRGIFRPFGVTLDGTPMAVHSLTMAEDSSRTLWVGLWNGGLITVDPYTGNAHRVLEPGAANGLLRIHSINEKDGSLLIGSDSGLTVYNPSTGDVQLLKPDELDSGSLSDRFVYPIVNDREGGLWIGTFYGGVNYLAPELKQFESYRHSNYANSVSGDIVSAFCEDSRGKIWIGTDDGGLTCMNPDGRFTRHRLLDNDGKEFNENVHAICSDGDDLWIGTYASGVWVYNPVTGATRRYMGGSAPGSLDDSSSYTIFRDTRGNIWVATTKGIFTYHRDTDDFEAVRHPGALTADIDQDPDGNLWFSTQGKGIFRFDPYHSVWKNYRTDSELNRLPSNFVNSMFIDSSGRMWAATADGLALYNALSDSFEPVEIKGHKGNVYWITEDDNSLWLSTARGVLNYHLNDGRVDTYTVDDGLVSLQFSPNAGLKSSDRRIFLGSARGFNAFYPRRIRPNTTPPTVAFTGVDIVNKRGRTGDRRISLPPDPGKGLRLSHDDYLFFVEFAALSYANPGQNRYAYKLEGFDKDWIETGTDNRATFTNLQPGDYTLRVKASNNDNVWSESEIALPVHVSPPWYASWPMKILYALLILGFIVACLWLTRLYYERRHRRELDNMASANERRLYKAKLDFFTMIAHEIRTPVSLIIGPIEQILRAPAQMSQAQRSDLEIINRNSRRLLSLVDQLLDFKKVEQSGMQVKMEHTRLDAVLRSVAERFDPAMRNQGIELALDLPSSPVTAIVDSEAVTKMVSNLLGNARKFARKYVQLSLTADEAAGTVSITVKDDGCGIPPEDIGKIFNPFYQVDSPEHRDHGGTGIGLSIVKSAVDAHNGTVRIESEPGKGTAFIVTLPAGNIHAAVGEQPPMRGIAQDTVPDAPSAGQPSTGRPILLVVDDNDDMLRFIESNFSRTYDVVCASDGNEALRVLDSRPVDFIISDWMMPGLSGVDLCRRVRSNPAVSHIPFILLTAKTDDYSKIKGLNCGADAYVAKPFSVAILEARISGLLNIRDILRKKFSSTPLEPVTSVASNPVDIDFLGRLTAEIERNFSNPDLSVDSLAEAMGISRSSLYAKIKSLLGVPPNELIQLTRLKKAAALLAEGKYRVSEVSYMVGFNSSSYFSKCFQKQFGIKPTDFAMKKGSADDQIV